MQKMDLFLLIGQSNSMGVGNPSKSTIAMNGCFEYLSSGELIPMRTIMEFSENKGSIAPSFANKWKEMTGNDVCFIHCPKNGSRIDNWLNDTNKFLNDAINKFNTAYDNLCTSYDIGTKYAIWIQGESDVCYSSDALHYKKSLKDIATKLCESTPIEKMFVSLTGYWIGDESLFTNARRIAVSQEMACNECSHLSLGSKRAMTFYAENMLIDYVHYSQEALNILGDDLSINMHKYFTTKKDIIIEDTVNLDIARQYIEQLQILNQKYL